MAVHEITCHQMLMENDKLEIFNETWCESSQRISRETALRMFLEYDSIWSHAIYLAYGLSVW